LLFFFLVLLPFPQGGLVLEAGVSLMAVAAFWVAGGGFAACGAESDFFFVRARDFEAPDGMFFSPLS
jgi:hypothetical protein